MTTLDELKNRDAMYWIAQLENYADGPPMGPFKTLEEAELAFKEMVASEKWEIECPHFRDSLEDFKSDPTSWSDVYHIVKTVKIGTFQPLIAQEKYEFTLEAPVR